jgi:DNA-binding LacI/PurR family transcriptional regulator
LALGFSAFSLDYTPNYFAQGMKTSLTHSLGIIVCGFEGAKYLMKRENPPDAIMAATILIDKAQNPKQAITKLVLDCTLIVRGSTDKSKSRFGR